MYRSKWTYERFFLSERKAFYRYVTKEKKCAYCGDLVPATLRHIFRIDGHHIHCAPCTRYFLKKQKINSKINPLSPMDLGYGYLEEEDIDYIKREYKIG